MSLEFSYVYEFHITGAQQEYVCSHAPSDLPTALTSMAGSPSGQSQRLSDITGISTIGGVSFTVTDHLNGFRDLLATVRNSGESFANRKVIIYRGFAGDTFADHTPILTQTVAGITQNAPNPTYTIKCEDIQRELREDLFKRETRYITATVLEAETTTLNINDTTGFELVYHSAAYNVLPSGNYGIAKIGKEYIGYSGKTSTTLTGITRGLFNTSANEHVYDAGKPFDKQVKIAPVVYLELPAVKLLYALMTGDLYGDAATIPAAWHEGVDPADIDINSFIDIGDDLWDTTDDAKGWILRAFDPKKSRGKDFIEKQILLPSLLGLRVTDEGKFQLFRRTTVTADAPYVGHITESDIMTVSALNHDQSQLVNSYNINYNWNGTEHTRSVQYIDQDSITQFQDVVSKTLKFDTLHTAKHTQSQISQTIDALRGLYSSPPLATSIKCLPSVDGYNVGEVVRVTCYGVRDFTGSITTLDRPFLIRSKKRNKDETISYELIGSTAASVSQSLSNTAVMQDAFYTSQGTNLSTLMTITAGNISAGTYNLTGHSDANNAAAVYYFDGDLTGASNVHFNITENVQIRVKGFFDFSGNINGIGTGTNTGSGFVGNTRGMDGVLGYGYKPQFGSHEERYMWTEPAALTRGKHQSFPVVNLINSDGSGLAGIPSDLRGSGGGVGGKCRVTGNDTGGPPWNEVAAGGAGATGTGAGLVLISRGANISGDIDLSGTDSAAATSGAFGGSLYQGGAGASTGGGSLLLIADGSLFPVVNRLISKTGNVPVVGRTMTARDHVAWAYDGTPYAGFPGDMLSQVDYSGAALRIQYAPPAEIPFEEVETVDPVDYSEITNTPTLGTLAGLNEVDWTSHVGSRPANIAALIGSEPILNTGITLSSGGALSGAGGGSVTIGGLGYTGALNANYITATTELTDDANLGGTAIWSGVASIPANLDGLVGSEPILNTGVTLSSAGVLSGAGGGSVTIGGLGYTGALNANYITATTELTDDANLGGTAAWTGTTGRPANLTGLAGTEPILNTGITINSNGSLSGAGAGAVTIGGLGYTGALNANYITNTTEITDGANLGLTADWPSVTGVGIPEDNATVGAVWGSNITSQPSDTALLNVNTTPADIGYTGSLNATENNITSGTAIPTGGVDGDLYYETDAKQFWKKEGGVWAVVSTYNTGALADLDNVNLATQVTGVLGTGNAAADLINTNVSISAAGALSGAGGGSVTIGGLGYTGALNANYITNTTELTDGANHGGTAVWSGLSSIPTNLGSLVGTEPILNANTTPADIGYTGDLDATAGATWGIDIGGANLPADNADVTDYTATANLSLVHGGTATAIIKGNSVTNGSDTGWQCGVHSLENHAGAVKASWRIGEVANGTHWMAGLSKDHLLGSGSYSDIDFAWYLVGATAIAIYENNVSLGTYSTSAAIGDVLSVEYDGDKVRYYQNGALKYTSLNKPSPTDRLGFDASMNVAGAKITDINLTPMSVNSETFNSMVSKAPELNHVNSLLVEGNAQGSGFLSSEVALQTVGGRTQVTGEIELIGAGAKTIFIPDSTVSSYFRIHPKGIYEVRMSLLKTTLHGRMSFGLYATDESQAVSTLVDRVLNRSIAAFNVNNPYWCYTDNGANYTANKWYDVVCYLLGSEADVSQCPNILQNGVKMASVSDGFVGAARDGFRLVGTRNKVRLRVLNYDNTAGTNTVHISDLSVKRIDGIAQNTNQVGDRLATTISDTILGTGLLATGSQVNQGDNTYRQISSGIDSVSLNDGDTYTYPIVHDSVPVLRFEGGLTQSTSLTGDQQQVFQALSSTVSGFTASFKVRQLSGSAPVTETGAVNTGVQDWEISKTVSSLESSDDSYTYQIDVSVTNGTLNGGEYPPGNVTVGYYTNDNGAGWVQEGTKNFGGSYLQQTKTHLNNVKSYVRDGLAGTGNKFGVTVESSIYGGSITSFDNVTYNASATPAETSATPTGASSVKVFIIKGT